MKKLMVAAAAAAMTAGAFAGLCDIDAGSSSCEGYDVSVSLKTLSHKVLKCKENCLYGKDCVPYFVNGKRTLKGIIWMCESDCGFEGAQLILWRADKTHKGFAIGSGLVVENKQYVALDFQNNLLGLVNRYDKKANKAQMAWSLNAAQETWWDSSIKDYRTDNKKGANNAILPDYTLQFAGFGSFDTKNLRVKSISGGVAGTVGADPSDAECVYDYGFLVSTCAEFSDYCEGDGDIQADPDSTAQGISATSTSALAAYGTWKLKYNAKYAKDNKSIASYVPTYAK